MISHWLEHKISTIFDKFTIFDKCLFRFRDLLCATEHEYISDNWDPTAPGNHRYLAIKCDTGQKFLRCLRGGDKKYKKAVQYTHIRLIVDIFPVNPRFNMLLMLARHTVVHLQPISSWAAQRALTLYLSSPFNCEECGTSCVQHASYDATHNSGARRRATPYQVSPSNVCYSVMLTVCLSLMVMSKVKTLNLMSLGFKS